MKVLRNVAGKWFLLNKTLPLNFGIISRSYDHVILNGNYEKFFFIIIHDSAA
jgi:hypothetical protein